ncbi:MAG: glycerophosphodiester phosphodiesterase [Bacteroidetes bacterium]|nr:glycerophosphodiester phosphodiesterase [Bacteroidota bacterium]
MNKLWFFPVLIFVCVFVVWAASIYISNAPDCVRSEGEIWSHRGVHTEAPENSRDAIRIAIEQGFYGVELDVFYDNETGLVVSHDLPYKKVNGEVVLLEDIFSEFGDTLSYWIDLKNLHRSNRKAVKIAFQELTTGKDHLRSKILIESANGRQLRYLNKHFNCIYWVQFSRKFPRKFFKLAYIRSLLARTDFTGISTDHRYIDAVFEKNFRNMCWYVFTVNEPDKINILAEKPEVQVILTDLEEPYVLDTVE